MPSQRLRDITPDMQVRLDLLRRWSTQLDSVFRVPGTGIRFGWDPIVGLVPWAGDVVTALYAMGIVVTGMQLGIPRIVQARMLVNVAIDALAGAVPLVGDMFDVAWKANIRNMRLLDEHARGGHVATTGDWLFVGGIVALIFAVAAIPLIVLVLLLNWAGRGIF
jgi:hypothetical protein